MYCFYPQSLNTLYCSTILNVSVQLYYTLFYSTLLYCCYSACLYPVYSTLISHHYTVLMHYTLFSITLFYSVILSITLLYSVLLYSNPFIVIILYFILYSAQQLFMRTVWTERKNHVLFKARVKGLLKGTSERYNEGHVIFCALTHLDWLEERVCCVTHRGRLYKTTPPSSSSSSTCSCDTSVISLTPLNTFLHNHLHVTISSKCCSMLKRTYSTSL